MQRLEEIAERIAQVFHSRPEVLEGYVFGSLARREGQAHSDIDVAVYVDSAAPASPFGADAEIAAELGSVLGTNRVDVTLLNGAGPLLYHRVLRDGIRVFSRDLRATTVREGRALSRYCDYLPQLAKIRAVAERRARTGAFGR